MSDDVVARIVAALEPRFAALEVGQADLKAELARTRADLMERLDRHENRLNAIRDDIAVNFGASNQVRDIADHTRAELRGLSEVVAAMQRQIHRLQTEVQELRGGP